MATVKVDADRDKRSPPAPIRQRSFRRLDEPDSHEPDPHEPMQQINREARDAWCAKPFSYVPADEYDHKKHGDKHLVHCESSGKKYYTASCGALHWVDNKPMRPESPAPAPPAPAPLPVASENKVDMGAPDMGAPDMGAPDMGAPDMGAPDMGATYEALFGEPDEQDDPWEMIDRMALTEEGKMALSMSDYADPKELTTRELSTLFERKCFLPPPRTETGSVYSSLDAETFHALAIDLRPSLAKSAAEPLWYAEQCTSTSILKAASELVALAQAQGDTDHPEKPTSMGLANFQLALAFVAMMTAPNSNAWRQLLNRVTGGASPEHVIQALNDPKYVTMIWTFDQFAAKKQCGGTRLDKPLAELTKQRMLGLSLPGTLQIESRDGNPNDYVGEINNFCNKGTDGMIPEIVKQLDPECVAVMLSCVCLKVSWQVEGKCEPPQSFYGHPGRWDSHNPIMDEQFSPYGKRVAPFAYAPKLLEWQRYFSYTKTFFECCMDYKNAVYWLKLDCKRDGDIERFMLYGLPHPGNEDYERSLARSAADLKISKFKSVKFNTVIIPCVDIETNTLNGKKLLMDNGVSDIFVKPKSMPMMFWSPPPDEDGGVVVSRIIHKSKFMWDEKGAEAAAASLVEFAYRSLGGNPSVVPNDFVMNRPGIAMLCKKIPFENNGHLSHKQCNDTTTKAGMALEFFSIIKGQSCANIEGSMGGFSGENKPGGSA